MLAQVLLDLVAPNGIQIRRDPVRNEAGPWLVLDLELLEVVDPDELLTSVKRVASSRQEAFLDKAPDLAVAHSQPLRRFVHGHRV